MSGGIEVIPLLAISILMEMQQAEALLSIERQQVRLDSADEVRGDQLQAVRERFIVELREVFQETARQAALLPPHALRLRQQAEAIQAALEQAPTQQEMWRIAQRTPRLQAELQRALAVKQRNDQSLSLETQQQELELQLQEQLKAREREAIKQCTHTEFLAMMAGLQADPVVMRWHQLAVSNLSLFAEQILATDYPAEVLNVANARANVLISEANEAELKAKQRDYITSGIARSLAEMGFVVSDPREEHPQHPATAKILLAASPAGKEISVSVPLEGQVWYEVEGYQQETVAAVGGGDAVVCDEAESVLTEMHARLEAEFQVEMGEISWHGKDPIRALRKADELPSSAPKQRGRGR